MISPYWGKTFVGFFAELGSRLFQFLTGGLPFSAIASDEIQIAVLALLAISCGLLGTFLQLRRMTMLANSLSHTILLGIVLAFLITRTVGGEWQHPFPITTLLIGSFVSALITTFLTQFITRSLRLQEDASIGLVFTTLFALGILFVTLFTRNVHLGTEAVMGNVDVLQRSDINLLLGLALANITLFTVFFKEFQILSFDANLAKTVGISALFFHYLLMVQLSATTIASFRAVGVLLVLAFLIGPFLIARLLTHKLKVILFLTPLIGLLSSVLGVALARHFLSYYGLALSTGGLVVMVILGLYIFTLAWNKIRNSYRDIVQDGKKKNNNRMVGWSG